MPTFYNHRRGESTQSTVLVGVGQQEQSITEDRPSSGRKANQIVDEIAPQPATSSWRKAKASAFFGTALMSMLNEFMPTVCWLRHHHQRLRARSVIDAFSYNLKDRWSKNVFRRGQAFSTGSICSTMAMKYADVIPLKER